MVVYIEFESALAVTRKNIRLPATEVLLCVSVVHLAQSNNLKGWVYLNNNLPPLFLTEAVVLDGETSVVYLLKIFAFKISERGLEANADTTEI